MECSVSVGTKKWLKSSLFAAILLSCHALPVSTSTNTARCHSRSNSPFRARKCQSLFLYSKSKSEDQETEASTASTSRAFGRNHIRHPPHAHNATTTTTSRLQSSRSLMEHEHVNTAPSDPDQDKDQDPLVLVMKRDRALLALHSVLSMDMKDATNLLHQFPQLYQQIPSRSLATRILYLRQELNLSQPKLKTYLQKHPLMMVNILQQDPQHCFSSTVEVLQTELQLSAQDILDHKLDRLDRMELRPKLQLLKTRLHMTPGEIVQMIRRNPLLLYQNISRLTQRMEYLVHGPVGEGLGKIVRRGKSVSTIPSSKGEDSMVLIMQRIRTLYRDFPDVVATPGLEATVTFLLEDLGCTLEQLGKITYRRPQLLQYNATTIETKCKYFAEKLGLPIRAIQTRDNDDYKGKKTKSIIDLMALMPDVFTHSIPSNLNPKFLYLQEVLKMNQTDLRKLIGDRPQILSLSLESNWIPKVEFLQEYMSMDAIRQVLVAHPQGFRESLSGRIQPRVQVISERGLQLLFSSNKNVVPLNFLCMTEMQWNAWVEADFDEARMEQAKQRLKKRRTKAKQEKKTSKQTLRAATSKKR